MLVIVAALAVSGCAYKPLKAPCAPDEGGAPLAYAPAPSNTTPEPFRSFDRCGPMRRI
ncbi:hypothetical protein [Lichenihabitans psoromatis]|uniref:hypothetical protein n=1 Tax=Lichenihabitans psoromatis TaxID=2528642 RepID=UPI001FDF32DD|nr:hypothetical protein [Lichenihabitans psoromatis]